MWGSRLSIRAKLRTPRPLDATGIRRIGSRSDLLSMKLEVVAVLVLFTNGPANVVAARLR